MVSHLLATAYVATGHLVAAAKATTKAKTKTSSSGGFEELIFIALIVLAAWLLFFRPRSRQAQNQRQLLSTLVVGDEVLTGAGIYGTVLDVYPDRITIETAPGTRMTVARSTVSRKVEPNGGASADGDHDGELGLDAESLEARRNGYAAAGTNGHGTAYSEDDAYDEDDEDDEDDDVYDEDDDVYDEDEDDVSDEDDVAGDTGDDDELAESAEEGGTDAPRGGGEGRGR